jgi:hypothetical protein
MKRLIPALLASLLLAAPVYAAPPTATLAVVSVETGCLSLGFSTTRGCITFQSEGDPSSNSPTRHVVVTRIFANFMGPDVMVESTVDEIDKAGQAIAHYRDGIHQPTGLPYSERAESWVAHANDLLTPISPVVHTDLQP